MSVQIDNFGEFKSRLKRLARKFRSLPDEVDVLIECLARQPRQGKNLGGGLGKIRLGSAVKRGDKSGGFCVITYYVEQTAEGDAM